MTWNNLLIWTVQGIDESSIGSHQTHHPLLVIILTYQRCGSTFLGQLFNWNPDTFYMFEPLDALYTSMYGTAQGWNIPSDITSFSNGSERLVVICHTWNWKLILKGKTAWLIKLLKRLTRNLFVKYRICNFHPHQRWPTYFTRVFVSQMFVELWTGWKLFLWMVVWKNGMVEGGLVVRKNACHG